MDNSIFDDLRDSGHVVVDYPGRKIAVYANTSGHVVLLCQEGGEQMCQMVEPDEIGDLIAALAHAANQAKPIADSMCADFEAFTAIAKAQGGAA